MKITVIVCNVASENTTIPCCADIDERTRLQTLFDGLGFPCADLSHYYEFSGVFSWNHPYLPYLITSGGLICDVPYAQAGVCDFMRTHGIADQTLSITVGYAQAGGPGFLELAELWRNAYPILEQAAVLCTLGATGAATVKWFCAQFQKKKQPPQLCFDVVYARQQWNHFELATLLAVEPARAKALLALLGYRYDRQVMQYVQGDAVGEIKEKLLHIKVYDIE